MTQYKSSSDLKDLAKEKLKGKYGISMLVSPVLQSVVALAFLFPALFLFFFVYIVSLTMETMHDITLSESSMFAFMGIYLLLILVCGLLIGVLNVGVVYFNLNLSCGRAHRVSDLFCGFRYHFKKALALSAVHILTTVILVIPYTFCVVMWTLNPDSLWIIGIVLSAALYIVVLIYIQLCWSQSYYLLSDFPQTSAMGLLKLSTRIMRGHKKRLLYIQFSFLPLDFLCACSSDIGLLWCTPYKNMTYTLFFLDMMQPAKPKTVDAEIIETKYSETENSETENASELF